MTRSMSKCAGSVGVEDCAKPRIAIVSNLAVRPVLKTRNPVKDSSQISPDADNFSSDQIRVTSGPALGLCRIIFSPNHLTAHD